MGRPADRATGKAVPGKHKARTVADWLAAIVVSVPGLTIETALDHSLARLTLLEKAAVRARAEQSLMSLQVNAAAVAASMATNGGKAFKDVDKWLREMTK